MRLNESWFSFPCRPRWTACHHVEAGWSQQCSTNVQNRRCGRGRCWKICHHYPIYSGRNLQHWYIFLGFKTDIIISYFSTDVCFPNFWCCFLKFFLVRSIIISHCWLVFVFPFSCVDRYHSNVLGLFDHPFFSQLCCDGKRKNLSWNWFFKEIVLYSQKTCCLTIYGNNLVFCFSFSELLCYRLRSYHWRFLHQTVCHWWCCCQIRQWVFQVLFIFLFLFFH